MSIFQIALSEPVVPVKNLNWRGHLLADFVRQSENHNRAKTCVYSRQLRLHMGLGLFLSH